MNSQASVTLQPKQDSLLSKAQDRDEDALNILFASCRRQLFRCALHIVHTPQDAEDAVQEAMLAAFTKLGQFERRSQFSTWMVRIVVNAALMQLRKQRSEATTTYP